MINFYRKTLGLGMALLLVVFSVNLTAQTDAGMSTPGATARAARTSPTYQTTATAPRALPVTQPTTDTVATPAVPPTVVTAPIAPVPVAPAIPELSAQAPRAIAHNVAPPNWLIVEQLLTLAGIGGFIAYYCGLTRAKNCGHTCTILLVGVMFGLTGYWISGFAVQAGGLGDAHAALPVPPSAGMISGLDHELGLMTSAGHHWGFMGSSGFFLATDAETRNGTAALFLGQAILLALTVTIALGGALERVRILSLAISAFLVGALIYPLLANWTWGGGWLAEMGREYGMGHGFIDLAGAGVIHLTAGMLALVLTLQLGPRYGRFGRNSAATSIPGHNLPFVIFGAVAILLSLTVLNSAAFLGAPGDEPVGGLAATNTLLGAAGGLLTAFFLATYQRHRTDPAALCRGLIGGAVAVSAGSALLDSWAAFVIGVVAACLISAATRLLERRRIDDPVGVVSVHGAGGAWGLIALGIFAHGMTGPALNGINGPVRGVLFGRGGGQLLAQLIGCTVCIVVVLALGSACVGLVHKIIGLRVDVADETTGLDWPKLGALGYQADADLEKEAGEETTSRTGEATPTPRGAGRN